MVSASWNKTARAAFTPIIDPELFDRAQPRPNNGKRAYNRCNPQFPLRQFARCGACGGPLTASVTRGSKGGQYPYYHCTTKNCTKSIPTQRFEGAFADFLFNLQPNGELQPLLTAILEDAWARRQDDATQCAALLRSKLATIDARKERLVQAFVYEKAIDKAEFNAEKARLENERAPAQTALEQVQTETPLLPGCFRTRHTFCRTRRRSGSRFHLP